MKAPYIALAVTEVAAIAGFTFLAYHFNHWWIALFALFFAGSVRTGQKGNDNE